METFNKHYFTEMPHATNDFFRFDFKMELPGWNTRLINAIKLIKLKFGDERINDLFKPFYELSYGKLFYKKFNMLSRNKRKELLTFLPDKFIKDMNINVIKESLYKMDRVLFGTTSDIYEVYKNPNEKEIDEIFDNFCELNQISKKNLSQALRGIIDDHSDIYVWSANLMHDKAIKHFKFRMTRSLRLIFIPHTQKINLEYYNYSGAENSFSISQLNASILQKLKNTGYKYLVWEIDKDNDESWFKQYDLNNGEVKEFKHELSY